MKKTTKRADHPDAADCTPLRTLLDAIARSGETPAAIAHTIGVDRATVWRVVVGHTIPSLTTADRIADAIGYELRLVRKPSKERRKGGA